MECYGNISTVHYGAWSGRDFTEWTRSPSDFVGLYGDGVDYCDVNLFADDRVFFSNIRCLRTYGVYDTAGFRGLRWPNKSFVEQPVWRWI